MRRLLASLVLSLIIILATVVPVLAATTADITVTATPAYVVIGVSPGSYDFGTIAESATPSTITTYFALSNNSTVQTDQTISVTTTTWSGGVTWAHAEDAVPGADIAGLKANRGVTWGIGDIVVKNGTPNYIYENCPIDQDYTFGLKLWAPTSFTDGVQKQITVRVSAVSG